MTAPTAPQFRSVDAHTGEVAPGGIATTVREIDALRKQLDDSRAEVAHYAHLNHVLATALVSAADTAKNAVVQEQELQDQLDELGRDSDELWQRAIRVQELEGLNQSLRAELTSARAELNTYRAAVSR